MNVVFGDYTLGVHAKDASYIFSYAKGGLESLSKNGTEWISKPVRPLFWRATTCNDRGNGFSYKSSVWMGADLFTECSGISVSVDGHGFRQDEIIAPANNKLIDSHYRNAKSVTIIFEYRVSFSDAARTVISYTVTESGMRTDYYYHGDESLPSVPALGIRFIIPFTLDGYEYEGLKGETYPDRCHAAKGRYSVDGLPVPQYVVPQECGMHIHTKDVILRKGESLLEIKGSDFAFSALPYTAFEFESAWHHDELPYSEKSVLSLFAAVRGVGGINSWGAGVREDCQIDAGRNYELSIVIS